MKNSKKFILALIIVLVLAIITLLAFPDLFDSGSEEDTSPLKETEINNELQDELFDS